MNINVMSKHIPAIAILVVGIVSGLNSVAPVNAQDTQQDYTDFQNCLSSSEVDGVVTEQQIMDCLNSTYGETTDEEDSSGDDTNDDSDGSDDSSQDDSNDAGS